MARVEQRINRVLTQYRESFKFLDMCRGYLGQIDEATQSVESIETAFNIDTAIGEQLTFIGRRLGFLRQHQVLAGNVIFLAGFACPGQSTTYYGFCNENTTWGECTGNLIGEPLTIVDDEIYRRMLRARAIQLSEPPTHYSLWRGCQALFGDALTRLDTTTEPITITLSGGLNDLERPFEQLFKLVLPLYPKVEISFVSA